MLAVIVEIVRWTDDTQPGEVECRLNDAWDREHTFIDKVPVFTASDLSASSEDPQPGLIDCQEIGRSRDEKGREVVIIDTEHPGHVESTSGLTRFEVLPEQLADH